jgi:hypothetical protein
MSAEVFQAAAASDYETLAALLIAMPEKERRAIHKQLTEKTQQRSEEANDRQSRFTNQVSFVGTGTARSFSPIWLHWIDSNGLTSPNLIDVFLCRPANICEGIVRTIFRAGVGLYFPTLFELVRRGVVDRPPEAQLQQALLCAVDADPTVYRQMEVVDLLCSTFHEENVIETVGDHQISRIVKFVVDGTLPRDRILAEVFRALCRDFRPGILGLFRDMLEKLEPTDAELQQNFSTLTQILMVGTPSNQTVAAELLIRVNAVHPFDDVDAVCRAIRSALSATQKATAVSALRLLSALEIDPSQRARTAVLGLGHRNPDVQLTCLKTLEACMPLPEGVVGEALLSDSLIAPRHQERFRSLLGTDVGGRVVGASDELSVETLGVRLMERLQQVPEIVRQELRLDERMYVAFERQKWPTAQVFGPSDVPRTRRVEPIVDADELVELFFSSIAGSVSALDIDRIVDGVTRIPTPSGAAKRLASLTIPDNESLSWACRSMRHALLRTANSWGRMKPHGPYPYLREPRIFRNSMFKYDLRVSPSGENHWRAFDDGSGPSGVIGFITAKLWEAVTICFDQPRVNLAFPSGENGWIYAEDLCERLETLKRRNESPGRFEALHALARLHPEHDEATQPRLRSIDSKFANVVLDVLREEPSRDADDGVRVTLASRPEPKQFVALTDAATYRTRRELRFVPPKGYEVPARRRDNPIREMEFEIYQLGAVRDTSIRGFDWWHSHSCAAPTLDADLMRWTQIAFPNDRPIFEARIASVVGDTIEENRTTDCLHLVVSALADPDQAWSSASYVLLATSLVAKAAILSAAAVDVFFAGAADGRLDTQQLGEALAELTKATFLKPSRLADRFSTIVKSTPLVAEQIRRTILAMLANLDVLPGSVGPLLELLDIACSTTLQGVDDQRARVVLEGASVGSSKTAKSAKRLLQLPTNANASLLLEATEALVLRGERWANLPTR